MSGQETDQRKPGQDPWKQRAVAAEINGRRVNEAIERGEEGASAVFVCECGRFGCNRTIELSLDSYEAVRTGFNRFIVAPGHELEEIESVLERHAEYLVVAKREPEAKAKARQADERSR